MTKKSYINVFTTFEAVKVLKYDSPPSFSAKNVSLEKDRLEVVKLPPATILLMYARELRRNLLIS